MLSSFILGVLSPNCRVRKRFYMCDVTGRQSCRQPPLGHSVITIVPYVMIGGNIISTVKSRNYEGAPSAPFATSL